MRRTVANINPKIIHFDAVILVKHHLKSYTAFDAQCTSSDIRMHLQKKKKKSCGDLERLQMNGTTCTYL